HGLGTPRPILRSAVRLNQFVASAFHQARRHRRNIGVFMSRRKRKSKGPGNIKAETAYDPFPKSGLVKQYGPFIRKHVRKFCEGYCNTKRCYVGPQTWPSLQKRNSSPSWATTFQPSCGPTLSGCIASPSESSSVCRKFMRLRPRRKVARLRRLVSGRKNQA